MQQVLSFDSEEETEEQENEWTSGKQAGKLLVPLVSVCVYMKDASLP